jgi:PhzF family phenazine biosynthesis protein
MGVRIVQADAFATEPFRGNPAAVCLLESDRPAAWRQAVAAEMNLSETAFVERIADGFRLRWFTPVVEVDLCGHATLAAAHTLWQEGWAPGDSVLRFETRSGVLTARRRDGLIELDFPAEPPLEVEVPAGVEAALGVRAVRAGRNRFDLFIEVADEATVRAAAPDFRALRDVDARGVIVTSAADGDSYDFVSRFFGPRVGVDEDPVTGSAHCGLAPWWGERLGRDVMTGYQASARGGTVHVTVQGDRVLLAGGAVTVMRGELMESADR